MFNQIIALALILFLAPFAKAGSAFPPFLAISLPGGDRSITPPPQPVAVNVKIKIGGSVKIPLAIYGQSSGDIGFLIRNQPRHGSLSKILSDANGGSYVIYKNNGDASALTDRFFYAASSVNGVSAAVPVEIAISDEAPQFHAPQALDFGAVLVGGTVTRSLTITNSGGGHIDGELRVNAPWKIIGDTGYSLARKGGARRITLSVTPGYPGALTEYLRYTNDELHPTKLSVIAIPIFSAPESVVLAVIGTDLSVRSASIKITSAISRPLTLTISAPGSIIAPAQILVPANGSSAFSLTAAGLGEVATQLSLTADSYTQIVTLRAAAEPAQLQASVAALELRAAQINESRSAKLTLRNNGGAVSDVTLSAAAPFSIAATDAHFQLAAGAAREIAVSGSSEVLGEFHALLKIHSATQDLQIPLTATVGETATTIVKSNTPASPQVSGETANGETLGENPASPSQIKAPRPLFISHFRVQKTMSDGFVFAWKRPPKNAPLDYHIESAKPRFNAAGEFSLDWIALDGVKIKTEKNEVIATISGLQPETMYALRIAGVNATTHSTESSPAGRFLTASSWSPLDLFTPLRTLIFALIVFGAILLRRKMRARPRR